MIRIYEYPSCSTCKQALKFLNEKDLAYERISIVDQPPSREELEQMLAHLKQAGGSIRNLFNTSGILYRDLRIADKLKDGLTESEALNMLSKHGKLIKRPFVMTATNGTVGFKADAWKSFFNVK